MKDQTRKPHAIPGNKNGIKLKDLNVRQQAFRQYCDHLASGYPKECFFFDHPTHSVTWETMDKYIAENPSEFSPILIRKAKALRFKHWLDEGKTLMKGGYKNGSPLTWQVFMRNMFRDIGWDSSDSKQPSFSEEQRQLIESIFSQIGKLQKDSKATA